MKGKRTSDEFNLIFRGPERRRLGHENPIGSTLFLRATTNNNWETLRIRSSCKKLGRSYRLITFDPRVFCVTDVFVFLSDFHKPNWILSRSFNKFFRRRYVAAHRLLFSIVGISVPWTYWNFWIIWLCRTRYFHRFIGRRWVTRPGGSSHLCLRPVINCRKLHCWILVIFKLWRYLLSIVE